MYKFKIRNMVDAEFTVFERVFKETKDATPDDTIDALAAVFDFSHARRIVATLVNAVSPYDGRIYDSVREWSQSVKSAPTHEELEEIGIYGVDWIHSAHVNQIGMSMKKRCTEG